MFPQQESARGPHGALLAKYVYLRRQEMHGGHCRALLAKSVLILASAQGTFGFTKSGPLGALLAKYVLTLGKRASPSELRKELI